MLYFTVHPNYTRLSKYFQFQFSTELMYQYHQEGFDIIVNSYYTEQLVKDIEDRFRIIIDKYSLAEYHDDLLFLSLSKLEEFESILYELQWAYDISKRTKELANYLLVLHEVSTKDIHGLLLKTTLKDTVKLSDPKLVSFIHNLFIEAIHKGKVPANLLDFNVQQMFFDEQGLLSKEKLLKGSQVTITKPTNGINSALADFCFHLYPYLTNETDIKPDASTLISDRLLNFYFDLLSLYGLINPDDIQSEPKDYTRSLLMNHFKKINPHYQGNKSK